MQVQQDIKTILLGGKVDIYIYITFWLVYSNLLQGLL